ncbi:GNAT family N-acetyltransferase [Sinomicrobium sp. M5D2P17]
MTKELPIHIVEEQDFDEIVEVWEASVRATHDFVKEEDITFFRPLIRDTYLKMMDVKCIRNEEQDIVAFLGVSGPNIEMLFIHPEARGKGLGKRLLQYAVAEMHTDKVDVNEDNVQAVGFYKHMGFKTVDRSALDSTGKPYPIVHMVLDKA